MPEPTGQTHPIEIHLSRLDQLFESLDPSPFWLKDLDPAADEYIVSCARDAARGASPMLVIRLDEAASPDARANATSAVHAHFGRREADTRRALRRLFRIGRLSMLIGLAFLGASIAAGRALSGALPASHMAEFISQSLSIGGWVAMWRPLEIFLYDWWPVLRDARMFGRMRAMPVRIDAREA